MKPPTFYIAGPMDRHKNNNRPAFSNAATVLRLQGYNVVNPMELHNPMVNKPWEEYLKVNIRRLVQCDIVVLLAGWQFSKGAQLEKYIADHLCIPCYDIISFLEPSLNGIREPLLNTQSFNLLFHEIVLWQKETFGKSDSPLPPLKHLVKEVQELIDAPLDRIEYADCLFLLFNALDIIGCTPDDFLHAVRKKLEINQSRKWGSPDKDGVVEHLRNPTEVAVREDS